jgi:hypothetical protein
MANPLRSYSKPLALTHKHAEELRKHGPHLLYQEKVDGSQFSFGIVGGVLRFRSRNVEVDPADPGMFARAVESVSPMGLRPGWTYRGEYLSKPKHNTLCYGRVPHGYVILFDIDRGHCDYAPSSELAEEAERIGLESVPWWTADGPFNPAWLEEESCLGGAREGVVIKDYAQIGRDGKVLMAKVVRKEFLEVHSGEWKKKHPTSKDIVGTIIEQYNTEARWAKAVQHLKEGPGLLNAPQDIGPLLKEVQQDIEKECAEEIAALLWKAHRKTILRGCIRGLPEWYKAQL